MLVFLMCATITGQQYSETSKVAIGYVNIVFVWLHGVAYALAWSGLLVAYTVEVLPFKLRAKGLFIMNLSVQVALTINNQVNPIPISKGGAWYNENWKLFAVYTGWVLLELIFVYFFYVETRYVFLLRESRKRIIANKVFSGPTLEEIARIFDGENAEVGEVDVKEAGITNRTHSIDYDEERHIHHEKS